LGKFLTTHGVTGYFATTVAAPLDDTYAALGRLADAIEAAATSSNGDGVQARPLGIHLEGPFLSHKRRGVHPPENLVTPTVEIFDRLWQAARGHVRMLTIAPEIPGAMEVIAEAAKRKVCVSIGHSDAELPVARDAVKAGARHATHTFNAMRPLDHREPGIIGEVLTDDQLTADIIVDGIHVAPEVVKLFLLAKGHERAVLITDAISATGMPDGRYQLGPIEVDVKDGKCTSGGSLAGSGPGGHSESGPGRGIIKASRSFGAGRRCRFHGVESGGRCAQDDCSWAGLLGGITSAGLVGLAASGVRQMVEQHEFVGTRELIEERASCLRCLIACGFRRAGLAQFVSQFR